MSLNGQAHRNAARRSVRKSSSVIAAPTRITAAVVVAVVMIISPVVAAIVTPAVAVVGPAPTVIAAGPASHNSDLRAFFISPLTMSDNAVEAQAYRIVRKHENISALGQELDLVNGVFGQGQCNGENSPGKRPVDALENAWNGGEFLALRRRGCLGIRHAASPRNDEEHGTCDHQPANRPAALFNMHKHSRVPELRIQL